MLVSLLLNRFKHLFLPGQPTEGNHQYSFEISLQHSCVSHSGIHTISPQQSDPGLCSSHVDTTVAFQVTYPIPHTLSPSTTTGASLSLTNNTTFVSDWPLGYSKPLSWTEDTPLHKHHPIPPSHLAWTSFSETYTSLPFVNESIFQFFQTSTHF